MKLVLDTNVVISGLLWSGNPRQILDAARVGRVELFTSRPLLEELTTVLERRKFEGKITASGLPVDAIVDRYAVLARLVRPEPTKRIVADPDDDVVIGTALAAKADWIVSGDGHLLELRDYQGIRILAAADALVSLV
jgi:putative PIN family toxin of toxin-antitoxin system